MKQAAQNRAAAIALTLFFMAIFSCPAARAQSCTPANPYTDRSGWVRWCSCMGGHIEQVSGNPACVGASGSGGGSSSGFDTSGLQGALQDAVAAGTTKFIRWMLNIKDPEQEAQQQAMMAEIARRQAEAEREHREEEARRLAAMYNRLNYVLIHRELPNLQRMERPGSSTGLQFISRDSTDGTTGIQGLPGIYLNNGQNKPYGIPGLPGIYTGGPGQGSGLASGSGQGPAQQQNPASPPLAFITRDSEMAAAQTSPPAAAPAVPFDPSKMTPQQLADAADAFSKLPPEEQQRIMAAAQQNAAAAQSAPGQQPLEMMHRPSEQAVAPLQQQAAASQAAATAPTPEAASAQARAGFDTPLGGLMMRPSTTAPFSQPPSAAQQTPTPAAPSEPSTLSPVPSHTATYANVPSPAPPHGLPTQSQASSQPSRISQLSDAQLQAEIARMRQKFVNMQGDFQADAGNIQTWAHESEAAQWEAVEAGTECFSDLLGKAIDKAHESKEEDYQKLHKDAAFEKEATEQWKKARGLQWELSKAGVEHSMSDREREDKLKAALSALNGVYEYIHKGELAPWVTYTQCVSDYGYASTKFYLAGQQIDIINDNLGSATGKLKAEQTLSNYYKQLINEQQRRKNAAQ